MDEKQVELIEVETLKPEKKPEKKEQKRKLTMLKKENIHSRRGWTVSPVYRRFQSDAQAPAACRRGDAGDAGQY